MNQNSLLFVVTTSIVAVATEVATTNATNATNAKEFPMATCTTYTPIRRKTLRAKLLRVATYVFLILFTLATLYPIIQVFSISLRPGDRLLSTSLEIIPDNATFDSYIKLFTERPFLKWAFNSVVIAIVVMLTGVALASTAGYAFSRFNFLGKKVGMLSLLVTQMFPATMLLLPMYIMLIKLGLINSYLGIVIVYLATALPFCIWQMKGYYDTIPFSLEESARIDGCNQFQAFYRVILPLAAPALVITALFSFMAAWSEYLVAAQILQDTDLWTLPLGLKSFESSLTTEWGLYAAASLVVSIPVVVLFLVLSKWLVSGLTLGSVKG
jgi:arabinogalactan oligomer/maltooligosaccharide transport system permease protein